MHVFNVNLDAVWSMIEWGLPKLRTDAERILLIDGDVEQKRRPTPSRSPTLLR